MLGVVLLLLLAVWVAFLPLQLPRKAPTQHSAKFESQMKQLWKIAQGSMRGGKPNRAERALLSILKFDEKNAAAYNRLGILYARSQKYAEAIECFEIAQSLDKDNPNCLHNVGLIYLETGEYEKAEMAFRQAIKIEGDVPARFIALANAQKGLGKRAAAVESLESAYEIDRSASTLRMILALHEEAGDQEAIVATTARIEEQIVGEAKLKKARVAKRNRRAQSSTPARPQSARRVTARPATARSVVRAVPRRTAMRPKIATRKVVQSATRGAAKSGLETSSGSARKSVRSWRKIQ